MTIIIVYANIKIVQEDRKEQIKMNEKFNHNYTREAAEAQHRYDALSNTTGVLAVAMTHELTKLDDVKPLKYTKEHHLAHADTSKQLQRAINERAAEFKYADHNAKYRDKKELTPEETTAKQTLQNIMGNL